MLTELACKALITDSKRIGKPLKKSDKLGLFLHAFPSGAAYWYHKYTFNGRNRQLSYGHYPLISLADARMKQADTYKVIKAGSDPHIIRNEALEKEYLERNNSFEQVARAWHEHSINLWSSEHAKNVMRRLKKNLFCRIGADAINQLKRKQLLATLREIEARSPSDARRCVQYLTRIFTYAHDEEYIEVNNAIGLEKSLAPQRHGHFASMDIDMLPEFLSTLRKNECGLSEDRCDAIELVMLTAVRPNELIKAEWSEFNFEKSVWTIPAARMKMRNDHLVPLSRQAKEILLKRYNANLSVRNPYPTSKYVFPSRKAGGKPMSHNTICTIVIDMGYQNKHTGHGFRALFMGIAKERLKYDHVVPDRQLAHKPKNNVDRAYDRATFFDQRVKLMQDYADYIEGIEKPKAKGMSVQFKIELAKPTNEFISAYRYPYSIHQYA